MKKQNQKLEELLNKIAQEPYSEVPTPTELELFREFKKNRRKMERDYHETNETYMKYYFEYHEIQKAKRK